MHYDMDVGSALVIGTGCMPNCNFALINAKEGMVCEYYMFECWIAIKQYEAYTIFMQYPYGV